MPINEKIRIARQKKKLTQAELAEQLNVSQQSIARWETGESAPRHNRIAEIAHCLGVEEAFFFTGKEELPFEKDLDATDAGVIQLLSNTDKPKGEELVDEIQRAVHEEKIPAEVIQALLVLVRKVAGG